MSERTTEILYKFSYGVRSSSLAICRRMTRDPAVFVDPEAFIPERYLEVVDDTIAKKRDPWSYVFGFGRR